MGRARWTHSCKREARSNGLHSWLFLPFHSQITRKSFNNTALSVSTHTSPHTLSEMCSQSHRNASFFVYITAEILIRPTDERPMDRRITSKLDSFSLSVCDAVCYCSRSVQLVLNTSICPVYSEKGASA